MKFPNVKTLLIAGLIVGTSHAAFAQQAKQESTSFNFNGNELAANPAALGPSPVAGLLKEGIKLYGQKNYLEAAQKFYEVTLSDSPSAALDTEEAKYRLAMTLSKLKLYQSALYYYKAIVDEGESNRFFPVTLNRLVELSKEIKEDDQLTSLLRRYYSKDVENGNNNFQKTIPEQYRDRFYYLVGHELSLADGFCKVHEKEKESDANCQNLGSNKDIAAVLEKVKPSSVDYAKAQYIAGVQYTLQIGPVKETLGQNQRVFAKKAIDSFKNSRRSLLDKRAKDELTEDEKRLLELDYLGIARTFYQVRAYNDAIRNYSKIDRNSGNWPVALLESAFAYFNLNNYNRSLDNLQTVNSPFFSDRFFPKSFLLQGVVYYMNCRYDRAESVLDDFSFEYRPIIQRLEEVARRYDPAQGKDPRQAYRWFVGTKTGQLDYDQQFVHFVTSALETKEIRGTLKVVLSLQDELQELSKLPKTFLESKCGKAIKANLEYQLGDAQDTSGLTIVKRLNELRTEITKVQSNIKGVLTAITQDRKSNLDAEIRGGGGQIAAAELKEDKIKTNSEELVWSFDGEYWRDELGYYAVSIVSQCKR